MKKYMILQTPGILFTAVCLSLVSCYPVGTVVDPYYVAPERQDQNTYYVPAAPHSPLLTEKGDINFNILRSSGSKFNGAELQLAYMPGKHVGIGMSYSGGGHKEGEPQAMNYSRFELMSGYVKKLRNGWHFESYGGLGTGGINNTHYTGKSHIKLNHFFLQPAIVVSNDKQTVQFGIASRFTGVHFNVNEIAFDYDREVISFDRINTLVDNPFHVMWEPSLIFRAGWKNFLFTIQYSHSSDLSGPAVYGSTDNFSFGVSVRGNTKKK
ncbi:MAG TPA: hypothetical protein VIZ28_16825 [Chitinophagaceae bacterium]